MRVRRGLIWILGAVAVLGVAQYALQYYGSKMLALKLAQARDWADIRVGSARFWLWGAVDLDRIRIVPTARLDAQLGLAPGYSIDIAHLRIDHFRFGWDQGPTLASLSMAARHVRLPVPRWRWAITVARSPTGRRRRPPTLRSMGVSDLPFDADIALGFTEGYSRPRLKLQAGDRGLARIRLNCALRWPAGVNVVRSPAGLEIRSCRLDYRDLGLMRRFEVRMAAENGIKVPELRREIADQIARDATRSHWPLLSTQAMQGFVSDPHQTLRLQIAPNEPIPLGRVLHGVWSGLPAYFGLTAMLIPAPGGSF